jgi:hypothetical protein
MSFDLAVWRFTGHAVTADEAARRYSGLCERPLESFIPAVDMAEFVGTVAERFHASSGKPDNPWAAEPDIGEDCAVIPIVSSLAPDVAPVIIDLARERGLVCFDPQSVAVYQPVETSASGGPPRLQLADGSVIHDPDRQAIENSIHGLSRKNWYVVFLRSENNYIQAGCGEQAGARSDQFVLEYRDGSAEEHWRTTTYSLEKLSFAFLEYFNGTMDWTAQFVWTRLEVE